MWMYSNFVFQEIWLNISEINSHLTGKKKKKKCQKYIDQFQFVPITYITSYLNTLGSLAPGPIPLHTKGLAFWMNFILSDTAH